MRQNIHKFVAITTTLLAILLTMMEAVADELQSLEEIRKSAATFASRQIGGSDNNSVVDPGHLDPRLRLPRCNRPLDAELLGQYRNTSNITVTIKCHGDKPWAVHVPVKTSTFAEIFVADRPLPQGIAIQLPDLHQERHEISQLRSGYFESAETVVGRIPKRSLSKGDVITPNDLEVNKIIQRGNSVTILANSGGITVRMQGKALNDAAAGELIKVENLSSKRLVDAVALRPGFVEVPM